MFIQKYKSTFLNVFPNTFLRCRIYSIRLLHYVEFNEGLFLIVIRSVIHLLNIFLKVNSITHNYINSFQREGGDDHFWFFYDFNNDMKTLEEI